MFTSLWCHLRTKIKTTNSFHLTVIKQTLYFTGKTPWEYKAGHVISAECSRRAFSFFSFLWAKCQCVLRAKGEPQPDGISRHFFILQLFFLLLVSPTAQTHCPSNLIISRTLKIPSHLSSAQGVCVVHVWPILISGLITVARLLSTCRRRGERRDETGIIKKKTTMGLLSPLGVTSVIDRGNRHHQHSNIFPPYPSVFFSIWTLNLL